MTTGRDTNLRRTIWLALAAAVFVVSAGLDLFYATANQRPAVAVITIWLGAILTVGSLIVVSHPGHRVGIFLVATAPLLAFSGVTKSYAYADLVDGRGAGGGEAAAWLSSWTALPAFACLIIALLLFPSGRLPSPRWRWIPRALVATFLAVIAGVAFRPGQIDGLPGVDNPLATSWGATAWDVIGVIEPVSIVLAVSIIASLGVRLRGSNHDEKQQVKWLVYAVALFPILFLLSQFLQQFDDSKDEYLGFAVIMLGLMAIPGALGLSILRYRLYDIDVVINRTLVYGSLTAILAGTYLAVVVLLQQILSGVTRESDLAVAASTLIVAALFRPLRARLQTFIDRRFYRHKYDATETLQRFAAKLRDEVDLDSLSYEVIAVVGETVQPAHSSVWFVSPSSDLTG